LKPSLNTLRNSLREPSFIEFDSNGPRQVGALGHEYAGRFTVHRHTNDRWQTCLQHIYLSAQKLEGSARQRKSALFPSAHKAKIPGLE
jgi:hypothetical protein